LTGAGIVFADPDNGIRLAAAGPKLHKYALGSELADYSARGQSLVVYHHADRSAPAQIQAARRLEELARYVGQAPVAAVISRRGSCRFFLVTVADSQIGRLRSALESFARRWHPHVDLAGGLMALE
jgi:hypothetical protein